MIVLWELFKLSESGKYMQNLTSSGPSKALSLNRYGAKRRKVSKTIFKYSW
jgi:hypothetical protein